MSEKNKLEYGAYQVVNNCLRTKSTDRVCIITDKITVNLCEVMKNEFLKVTDNVKLFLMEDHGQRDETGANPIKFPEEIATYLKTCQVSVYAARGLKGELPTFRTPMTKITDECNIRHGHMPNLNQLLMETGMNADYAQIKENNLKIMKFVEGAKTAKVTTVAGTNIDVTFNPEWKWFNCDGNIQPGHWSNLPDGEVFTCAYDINGTLVVDGVLGDFMNAKYGVISETPVTFTFKDGRVESFSCPNKDIENDIKEYITIDENANRVGEFAIGTNLGLERLVGNLLQDEKFPGIHVALGHGYPEKTGSDWDSDAHLDMVVTKTTVEIDGKKIMEKGIFLV